MTDRQSAIGGRLASVGIIVYVLGYALQRFYRAGTVVQATIFSVTLLGLIAFAAGLHGTLRRTEDARPLVDLAFGSLLVAVVVEIVGWNLAAAASHPLTNDDLSGGRVLLAGADVMRRLFFVPQGIFIAATSLAMLESRSFPRWLDWLGLVSGIIIVVWGVVSGVAITSRPASSLLDNGLTLLGFIAWLGFGVWMLVISIIMFWRGRPRQTRTPSEAA